MMSPLSIGLVGCGRIGRNLVRLLVPEEALRLAAIEEPAEPEAVEYLLRFDTLLGRFPRPLERVEGGLEIAGRRVALFRPRADGPAPWADLGVTTVIEASGRLRTRAELEAHLAAGAHRVVLCTPAAQPPDLTVVAGVNSGALTRAHRIVSVGSVTANCAGPVLKLLHQAFGVERAFLTTVHAFSSQLNLADVPTPGMRTGRAAGENIIPHDTNADDLLSELLPELAGRVSGMALHVPVPNGSVVDLTCWHPRPVTAEEINAVVREAAAGELAGILAYETEPIVSSDVLGTSYSGVFDSLSTMIVAGRVSKTLTFYDNAWGYANRVLDVLRRFAAFELEGGAS
jgi:glyceraldehyde 3-phosphate dehydrogenase